MKKCLFVLFTLLCIIGCGNEGESSVKKVKSNSFKKIKGKIIIPSHINKTYYDIQIVQGYYGLLMYENNEVLHIYDVETNYYIDSIFLQEDKLLPRFVRKEGNDNDSQFCIFNNKFRFIQKYHFIDEKRIIQNTHEFPALYFNFGELPLLAECILTNRGLYAILLQPKYDNTFYFFDSAEGVFFAEPYLNIDKRIPNQAVAYSSHIAVNESENCVVTASRFTNTVHFYDLKGNLKQVSFFGNETINPVTDKKGKDLDIGKSRKCFIGAKSTSKYVYCLYSGSEEVEAVLSKIVIFDWHGKHIRTLLLDRSLLSFDIDKSDKYLLGTSWNTKISGTDVLYYKL